MFYQNKKGDILNSNFYWLKTRETTVSSMEDSLDLFLTYFPILFFAIGFIGNVLVIRIVHKTRQMHTPTNYLLANMAVSDVITILLFLCNNFTEDQLGRVSHKFATFACKALSIVGICITVSSITLTVLALERYHALLKPFRTELRLSEDNVKKAIVFIWTTSVVISFPWFFFAEWNKKDTSCVPPLDKESLLWQDKPFLTRYTRLIICQSYFNHQVTEKAHLHHIFHEGAM